MKPIQKTIRAMAVLLMTLAAGGCGADDGVLLADGQRVSFDRWNGRWLIINYWAEWCAPCRKEIPELNLLHSEGAERNAVVLGVNYDGLTGEKLSDLVREMGIEFPVLVGDPRARWGADLPAVLPSTLIVDPAGELVHVLVGPQHYEDFIRAISRRESAAAL
ncbi:MAG TPA: TlpA disulfide reductase family protein [Pseudomonadales bacterium]